MTWIPIILHPESQGTLQQAYHDVYALYPSEYRSEVDAVKRPDGSADSIVAAHSLIPQALKHAMSAHAVLLAPELPLTRRQHEMIATVVSALNGCFY